MSAPDYTRFDDPTHQPYGGQPVVVVAAPQSRSPDATKTKRQAMIICGIIQVVCGVIFFFVALVKASKLIPTAGVHGFIACVLTLIGGSFGIQSGRTGGKCPIIASMVLSILASIICFSGLVVNSEYVAVAEVTRETELVSYIPSMYRNSAMICYSLMIFLCLVDFITTIVQAAFACAMVCHCCRSGGSPPPAQMATSGYEIRSA